LHRWGGLAAAIPLLVVIVSGLLLQVKKEVPWVQPSTVSGSAKGESPQLDWGAMLAIARTVEPAEIEQWSDIDRMDVRVDKGIVKIVAKNRWELQLDLADGSLLSSTYRRSDLIESLHDGSFFHEQAKLWVFLPNGLVLLGLWGSGLWLWYVPLRARRKQRVRRTEGQQETP